MLRSHMTRFWRGRRRAAFFGYPSNGAVPNGGENSKPKFGVAVASCLRETHQERKLFLFFVASRYCDREQDQLIWAIGRAANRKMADRTLWQSFGKADLLLANLREDEQIHPAPVDFRPFGAAAGPGSPTNGSGSTKSGGCARNQPRRPNIRPTRGHLVIWDSGRKCKKTQDQS